MPVLPSVQVTTSCEDHLLKDRSPIQRYQGRLEEGANKNLVKYSRDTC